MRIGRAFLAQHIIDRRRALGVFPPQPSSTNNDPVSGSASPSGTVSEAVVYANTATGAATPTGTLSEVTSTGTRTVPAAVVMLAGHRRGHWHAPGALLVTVTSSFVDGPTGAAAPTGSSTDARVGSDSPTGAAAATGTLTEQVGTTVVVSSLRVRLAGNRFTRHSVLLPPARVLVQGSQISDNPSGTAAATGSVVDAFTESYAVTGSAAPTGFASDSLIGGPVDANPILVRSVAVDAARMNPWKRRVQAVLFAPATVKPPTLPLQNQRTIRVVTAGRTRLEERRHRVLVKLRRPLYVPFAVYVDAVTGTAPPATGTTAEAQTHTSAFTGTAAATGTTATARVDGDAPTGTSSATGTRLEQRIGTDLVSGTSSATGTSTDSFTVGGPAFADSPTGSASPSGSLTQSLTGTNAVTGTAAPTGTKVEQKVYGDVATGAAAPSGTCTQLKVYGDVRTGSASPVLSIIDAKFANDSPTGQASPTGTCTDSYSVANVFSDNPTGTAAPSGTRTEALTHTSGFTGTATPAGSKADQKVYTEAIAGQAAPSGNLAATTLLQTSTPTGAAAPSGTSTDAKVGSDHPAGTSSASGTCSDSYTVAISGKDNPFGAASPTGTVTDARFGINVAFGVASASGSAFDQKVFPETVFGTSTPTGSVGFETYTYGEFPFGAGAASGTTDDEAFVADAFLLGLSTATGYVTERQVPGYGDVAVKFHVGRVTGRWAVKVRV